MLKIDSFSKISPAYMENKLRLKKLTTATSNPIKSVAAAFPTLGIASFAYNMTKLQDKIIKDNFYDTDTFSSEYSKADTLLQEKLEKYENAAGIRPYDRDKAKRLTDDLRSGEQRQIQIDALFELIENPKMTNGSNINRIVAQIKTAERARFWIDECNKLGAQHEKLSERDLATIIPKLKPDNVIPQEEFIEKVYLKHKIFNDFAENENFLKDFSNLLSTVDNSPKSKLQLDFFEKIMKYKNVNPHDAIELISNIDDVETGTLKADTVLSLMNKGFSAKDLTLLVPKIKNEDVAKLQTNIADYFMSIPEMTPNVAVKVMTNINSENTFRIQKDLMEKVFKLRDFKSDDALEILSDVQTKDKADLKYAVIKELAKIDKLSGKDIMHIVLNVDNAYSAEVKVKTAQNLLKIDKLSGENIAFIVGGTNDDMNANVKCNFAEELAKIDGISAKSLTNIISNPLNDEVAALQLNAVKEIIEMNKFSPDEIGTIVKGMRNEELKNAKMKAIKLFVDRGVLESKNIATIVNKIQADKKDNYLLDAVDILIKKGNVSQEDISKIITTMEFNKYTYKNLVEYFASLSAEDRSVINNYGILQDFHPFKDLYSLDKQEKRELLNNLIKHNSVIFRENKNGVLTKLFPFLPQNQKEYCKLVPSLIKAVNINIPELSEEGKENFFNVLSELANPQKPFLNINFELPENNPELLYSRNDFIKDVKNAIADLDEPLQREILNHFSISFSEYNGKTTMRGYPSLPAKKDFIVSDEMKEALNTVSSLVNKFNNENKIIISGYPEVEKELNEIFSAIPELYTTVGKIQNSYHDFNVFTHTLRVMQEVFRNPKFSTLSDSDKKLLAVSALMHDISKAEYVVDKTHTLHSALDASEISKRLGFSPKERNKMFAVIRNHSWLEYYNKENISDLQKTERAKHVAFALREGNAFDLVSILCEADLKSSQKNNQTYERFKTELVDGKAEVSRYVRDLQRTAIPLPQNKLPKASELVPDGDVIRKVNIGGISNKVIYLNKNINISKLGFAQNSDPEDFSVLVHALESEKKSVLFPFHEEADSTELLSASYVNLDKGNWKVFRQQGFILDVDSDNIHAAYYKDFGSGLDKNIDSLKLDYLFGGYFKPQRDYVSNLIKDKLQISDEKYRNLYQNIKDKSLSEIREQYPFVAVAIKKIFMDMQGGEYTYGRNYNEILVTRPRIQGVFAYDKSVTQIPKYLRKYAHEADIPIIIFEE